MGIVRFILSSSSGKWKEREKEMGIGNGSAAAAAAAMTMHVNASKTTMELKWVRRPKSPNSIDRVGMLSKTKSPPLSQPLLPIFISTKHSHINPDELAQLYSSCNFSCHRFPKYADSESHTPLVEVVDVRKLRIALSHSFVLVSVFCKTQDVLADSSSSMGLGDFFERLATPVSPKNGQLVGFGRAVSDQGLTASIYDVMVIPSLRRLGIGRMIVRRIIRMLTTRDIYDIAAVCSETERFCM
ncbi:GCN5-related N-acetyltransferase 3, chloroplastic isoform X2 [Ziziphus jujuba]|uniref:GCN5-related N-acetyltransferase 3, chloroplastic isoform X2 n=1 Tax=Ziziphus jujuba TaxID=326968 RepID=A0ABM3IEA1_ZIZJJ|nr:GCN5-related N-acetyltransferase 3, chloroplastic isoform X2 [Ziziphus jujuba]